VQVTRRGLLAAGGAAALTASCGPALQRIACTPQSSACPAGGASFDLGQAGARCELWAYDEIHRTAATVYRPANTRDLAALLRALSSRDPAPRVTVRAGGQSLDGQALNDDVVIQLDCADLDWIGAPKHDDQGDYITVGAAAAWGKILAATSAHGLMPYSMVTTSRATAGGTLSSDCLSRCSAMTGREGHHVRSFKLLMVGGEQIECRRDDPDPDRAELFHAAIGGYGYLGIITEITFDLRPALAGWVPGKPIKALTSLTKVALSNGDSWSRLLAQLREPRAAGKSVPWDAISAAAWFAGGKEQVLLFRSRYVVDKVGDSFPLYNRSSVMAVATPQAMVDPVLTEAGERVFFFFSREGDHVNDIEDFSWFMENQFGPAKALANREGWRLNVIQQTFVLPSACTSDDPAGLAAAATFLSELGTRLRGAQARPTMIDVLYLPADDFLLSANRAMCGFAVTLAWADRDGRSWKELSARLRALSSRCRGLGGRVHLVKNVEVDPGDLAAMYRPALVRFLSLKKRYDPRGILRNDFFGRVFGA
jgi:decaprenylphospho-beta-D-ribofuranose 2-oxidase